MKTNQDLEIQLKDVIGYMGFAETLKMLALIAENHADVQSQHGLPVSARSSVAAGLSRFAEEYEIHKHWEVKGGLNNED